MSELSLHDALALSLLPMETRRHVAKMLRDAYADGFEEARQIAEESGPPGTALEAILTEVWYEDNVRDVFKVDLKDAA